MLTFSMIEENEMNALRSDDRDGADGKERARQSLASNYRYPGRCCRTLMECVLIQSVSGLVEVLVNSLLSL